MTTREVIPSADLSPGGKSFVGGETFSQSVVLHDPAPWLGWAAADGPGYPGIQRSDREITQVWPLSLMNLTMTGDSKLYDIS